LHAHTHRYILKGEYLYFYNTPEDSAPLGHVHLRGAVAQALPSDGKLHAFTLTPATGVVYTFDCAYAEDVAGWCSDLQLPAHVRLRAPASLSRVDARVCVVCVHDRPAAAVQTATLRTRTMTRAPATARTQTQPNALPVVTCCQTQSWRDA
jgi:hypothetical protein